MADKKIMSAFVNLGPDETGRDVKKANFSVENGEFSRDELDFLKSKRYKDTCREYTKFNPNADFSEIAEANKFFDKKYPNSQKSMGIKGHVFWFKWVIPAIILVGGILLVKILL